MSDSLPLCEQGLNPHKDVVHKPGERLCGEVPGFGLNIFKELPFSFLMLVRSPRFTQVGEQSIYGVIVCHCSRRAEARKPKSYLWASRPDINFYLHVSIRPISHHTTQCSKRFATRCAASATRRALTAPLQMLHLKKVDFTQLQDDGNITRFAARRAEWWSPSSLARRGAHSSPVHKAHVPWQSQYICALPACSFV